MIRMNKTFKKSVSVLMVVTTLMGTTLAPISAASLSVMPTAGVAMPNALTLVSASKVYFGDVMTAVDSFQGVPAYYKVGDHTYDSFYNCAAYVSRFYKTNFSVNVSNMLKGRTPSAGGNGYSFKAINVRDAKPGDIGYHLNSTNSGGHWFIIKSADSNGLTVIEQNYKNAYQTSVNINRVVPYSMTQSKDLKVFRLYKNGVDMNGGGASGSSTSVNSTDDFSGVWCFKTDGTHVINVQYKSTAQDTSRIVVDGWNGETNEVWIITKVGNYYRISPTHEPNLALNALNGRNAKCGQWLTLHKWTNGDDASLWDIQPAPGGGVTIRNKANPDLYIDIDNGQRDVVGAKIQLWTKAGSNQVLYMERVSGTSTTTNATTDYSGNCALQSAAGFVLNIQYACRISDQAKMVIDPWNGELNEIFTITKIGNYYRISPAHEPNLAVNAQYGKDAKRGQQVSCHTWQNGDDASLWDIQPAPGGGVTIRNKANPNLYLDIDNGQRTVVGARVNLWTKADTGNQTIYLQKL